MYSLIDILFNIYINVYIVIVDCEKYTLKCTSYICINKHIL